MGAVRWTYNRAVAYLNNEETKGLRTLKHLRSRCVNDEMIKVSSRSKWIAARPLVPRTFIEPRPLQHLEMALQGRVGARRLVPRARPLQRRELVSRKKTLLVPRAPVAPRPLQHFEMPTLGRVAASRLVPWASVEPRPLENLQMPGTCRKVAQVPGFGPCGQLTNQREALDRVNRRRGDAT